MSDEDCVIVSEERTPGRKNVRNELQSSASQSSSAKRLKQARLPFRVKSPAVKSKPDINEADDAVLEIRTKCSPSPTPVVKKRRIELVRLEVESSSNKILLPEENAAVKTLIDVSNTMKTSSSCAAVVDDKENVQENSLELSSAIPCYKTVNNELIDSEPSCQELVKNETDSTLEVTIATIPDVDESVVQEDPACDIVDIAEKNICQLTSTPPSDADVNSASRRDSDENCVSTPGDKSSLTLNDSDESMNDDSMGDDNNISAIDENEEEEEKEGSSKPSDVQVEGKKSGGDVKTVDKSKFKTNPSRVLTKKQKTELKEQRERQRAEAKERRDRERNEYKLKKEMEKNEKENEREERKRQKLAEKQKKQEQLEQEKKKKEELRLEEKRKKDEERKKKEEEKHHEVEKISQKEKELMQKFFFKSAKEKPVAKTQSTGESNKRFMEFEVKPDMCIAPIGRLGATREQLLELARKASAVIDTQSCTSLYLDELRSGSFRPRTSDRTWCGDEVSVINIESGGVSLELQSTKSLMKAKLFQFHENHRPAYYGTWRKRSGVISGRHPLRRDKKQLDYEVDSDDEWEEEEPGESISHSEGENDEEQVDDDDDDDGFFVPHGYLSEDEVCADDNDEMSPAKLKEYQQAKARRWEAEMTSKRCEILKPICITFRWWDSTSTNNHMAEALNEFKMILLEPAPIQLMRPDSLSAEGQSQSCDRSGLLDSSSKKSKGKNWMPVPAEALPDLVKLVHGNQYSIQKIVREFREHWFKSSVSQAKADTAAPLQTEESTPTRIPGGIENSKYTVSKRQVETKIREIAAYELRSQLSNKKLWYVKDEVLHKLGLLGLPVPTQWKWSTKTSNDKVKLMGMSVVA